MPNERVKNVVKDEVSFCKDILGKVSRSFALTIPMLDDKLYKPVMIAYLQDRLLDNFEDEIEDIDTEKRKCLMDRVVTIFNPENSCPAGAIEEIEKYSRYIKGSSLRKLTENTGILYKAYDILPEDTKEIAYKWLKEMNKGMKKYLNKSIKNFSDLDEYCYYVAGTVGGFLTELIIHESNICTVEENKLLANYRDAGLFLQKVNIIRDIKTDIEQRKKNFWPLKQLGIAENDLLNPLNREKALQCLNDMIHDAKTHVAGLVIYMNNLPDCFPGYRKFFAVNNTLGLATLKKMENNPDVFYGKNEVKITKIKFLQILNSADKYFYKLSQDV